MSPTHPLDKYIRKDKIHIQEQHKHNYSIEEWGSISAPQTHHTKYDI